MGLPFWKKLVYLGLPFVLVFLVLEVALRLLGFNPAHHLGTSPQAYFFLSDAHLGWRNKPLGRYRFEKIAGAPVNTTDALGYRNGAGWNPDGQTPIILFIGDSAVFCGEVDDLETFPSHVAQLLQSRRPVQVLNGGVRGYNTVQALRRMEEALEQFPQITQIVYVSSSNDLLENVNPITRYPLRAPTVAWDTLQQRLTWLEVDTLAAPAGQPFVLHRPERLTGFTQRLRRSSALIHHIALRVRALLGTPSVLREKVEMANGALGPIDDGLPEWETQQAWARKNGATAAMVALLKKGQQIAQAHNIPFAMTAFTRGEPASWYDEAQALAHQANLPFIDVRPAFIEAPLSYAALRHDGLYDPHYGPKGTRTFAEAIIPFLEEAFTITLDSTETSLLNADQD